MPLNKQLHILMLDDNPADADLNAERLADAGLSFEYRRVENEHDYLRELPEFRPDVILADYRLQRFDGLTALRLARERFPFIPFIIVSGVLEEEAAAELFKAGAADYIRKGNIARLGTAVRNALQLKVAQEEKARAEEELKESYKELERRVAERTHQLAQANEVQKESAQRFLRIFNSNISGVAIVDFNGNVLEANDYFIGILEYTRQEFDQHNIRWEDMTPPEYLPLDYKAVEELKERGICSPYEKEYVTKRGNRKWVYISNIVLPGHEPKIIAFVNDITGRKRIEEALRREQALLQTIIDSIPVMLTIYDPSIQHMQINRNFVQATGWTPEDAKQDFMSKVYPDTFERERAAEFMQSLAPGWRDLTVTTKNGSKLASSWANIRLPDGRQVGIGLDIRERKQAEEALRKSEQEAQKRAEEAEEGQRTLVTLMDNIPEGIFIGEPPEGRIRFVSRYMTDITGVTREEFVGLLDEKVKTKIGMQEVSLTQAAKHLPLIRAIKFGEVITDDEWIIHPAGRSPITVLINARPVRDSKGTITGAVASWRDITERKKAEDALRRNEYELRTLVDNSPDIIFRMNRQLQYVYANPAYERITGRTKEQLIGNTNDQLGMPQPMVEFWRAEARTVIENGRERSAEFDMTGFFGKRYFFARLIPEFARTGLVDTVLVIARDITERKRAEEQIRYISFHDEVTGLFNRAFFEEEIRRVDTERDLPVSIIMGDVNNLKLTNDAFGHTEGDKLLKAIAESIRSACRQSDIIARWGGDEFVAILPKTDLATAGEIQRRIGHIARGREDTVLPPSIALGAATKEQQRQNIYQIIRQAEERMYDHKLSHSSENQEMVISCLLERTREVANDYAAHVERSHVLAGRFGKELGLPEDQMKDLHLLVDLHDIGDTAIPRDILTKPGRLNREEWNIMKKHPEAGFRIVKTYADTATISDEVLSHSEYWDGSGYPRGLKGKDIPYLARVFLIIDAYDVMTHPRPYARTYTREEATEELHRNAGKQFDPELVEKFIKITGDIQTPADIPS